MAPGVESKRRGGKAGWPAEACRIWARSAIKEADDTERAPVGDVPLARTRRRERGAVHLSLAPADHDLVALEVDVLDSDAEAFEEANAAAVEHLAEELEGRLELVEEALVEEENGAEGLVLGGRGGTAVDGEGVEEGGDLARTKLPRVAAVVKPDELADPVGVGFLGPCGVVKATKGRTNGVEEGQGMVLARGGAGRTGAAYKDLSAPRARSLRGIGRFSWEALANNGSVGIWPPGRAALSRICRDNAAAGRAALSRICRDMAAQGRERRSYPGSVGIWPPPYGQPYPGSAGVRLPSEGRAGHRDVGQNRFAVGKSGCIVVSCDLG